ncbi:MAG TPA: class I SAM-dependent methyltransferase [Gammaproteobacteria bacterium]|nr:class I SAM-dependent methyltransferase [Gammaproteobacteria bacterium]
MIENEDSAGRSIRDERAAREPEAAPVEAWDELADDYDRYVTPGEAEVALAALRLAGLEPGHRVLDVAAGTGGLSLPAARLGARVVATDWSPRMIERFEARVREEGLRNTEARVMDCHSLDFPDGAFDVAGSQFGVMLVPDQLTALREMARVTRPGGRVLLIAYGDPAEFEALHFFVAALEAVVPGLRGLPADPPLEFQVADPDVMRRRLVAAGLRDVRVDTSHCERIEVRSGQELWDWCLGGNPIPNALVRGLSREQRRAVLRALDDSVSARAGAEGAAVLTAPLNIGIGVK